MLIRAAIAPFWCCLSLNALAVCCLVQRWALLRAKPPSSWLLCCHDTMCHTHQPRARARPQLQLGPQRILAHSICMRHICSVCLGCWLSRPHRRSVLSFRPYSAGGSRSRSLLYRLSSTAVQYRVRNSSTLCTVGSTKGLGKGVYLVAHVL